jgi:hypothetical protein
VPHWLRNITDHDDDGVMTPVRGERWAKRFGFDFSQSDSEAGEITA